MRVLERRDRMDWWLTRPVWLRKLPLALMMLLALATGLGIGAMIWTGHEAPSSRVVQLVPGIPPGEVAKQQTPTASDTPPTFIEEIEIPVEPAVARAPTEEELFQYEKDIFAEVNRRRVEAGVPALVWSDEIAAIARAHSEDEARRGYYAHVDPEGRGPAQRFGTTNVAENMLMIENSRSLSHVVEDVSSWMNSHGHRENIRRGTMKRTGVGVAISKDGTLLITQNFLS